MNVSGGAEGMISPAVVMGRVVQAGVWALDGCEVCPGLCAGAVQ